MWRCFLQKIILANWVMLAIPTALCAADKVRFSTNWSAQGSHGGYYQALADGTYVQYGLDVEIIQGGPQVNSRPLLPAGRIDFLMGSNILLAYDNARNNIPTKAVAAIFQKDVQVLMAHKGAYKDFADLAHAEQILLAKDTQFSVWLWLKAKHGFRDEQVRPYNFNLSAFLLDKKIVQQAYAFAEPANAIEEGAEPEIYLFADYGWDAYSNIIETRNDLIDTNPDLVQRFIDATIIGFYNFLYGDNKAGKAAIMAANPDISLAKLDYEIATLKNLNLIDVGDARERGIGVMTEQRLTSFYETAVQSGLFEQGDVDLNKAVDLRFVGKGVGLNLRQKLTGK